MDLRKIKKLIDLAEASGLAELEVRTADETVRIVRSRGAAPPAGTSEGDAALSRRVAADVAGVAVRAPMAGTFYAAPEPGAEPFVREGQSVRPGDVLCIIESMKMLNEIRAEQGGICTAVAVANGQAVGAGDVLMRIA